MAYTYLFLLGCLLLNVHATQDALHFKIGFLPSMSDKKQSHLNEGSRYAGAIGVAMNALLNNSNHSNLTFSYIYKDTEYDTKETLKAIVNMYEEHVDVLLGPENSCLSAAELAASLNLPIIGFRCTDSILSDKTLYPTFTRTIPAALKVTKSIISLLHYYNWTSFSVVSEETTEWMELAASLRIAAKINDIQLNTNISTFSAKFRGFIREHQEKMCEIVRQMSKLTRVYVFLGEHDAMVQFMRCLGENTPVHLHTVIHVRNFDTQIDYNSPFALTKLTSFWHEGLPGFSPDSEKVDETFRQLITLQPRQTKNNDIYHQFEADVRYWMSLPPFNITAPGLVKIPISIYAAKVYDAMMIYAQAVSDILKSGGNPRNGAELTKKIINSTYRSIQQYTDTIDENGDAEGAYSTIAMVKDATTSLGWAVKETGLFSSIGGNFIKLRYNETTPMSWVGGKPPADKPACGFSGCVTEDSFVIPVMAIVVACSAVALIFFITAVYLRQLQQKKKIASLLWKLDRNDIELICSDTIGKVVENKHNDEANGEEALLVDNHEQASAVSRHAQLLEHKGSFHWSSMDSEYTSKERLSFYCAVAMFKNMLVAVNCVWNPSELTVMAKKQLHELKELSHANLNKFIGASMDGPYALIVTQYCDRGSLEDVLITNRDLFIEDVTMQYSLIDDLLQGMIFIHNSSLEYHGNLKSSKCLVDERFVLRINGLGQHNFRKPISLHDTSNVSNKKYKDLLWRAPELLRQRHPAAGSQKGDIFSFAIILHEIFGLLGPWGDTRMSNKDIVENVAKGGKPLLRPNLSVCDCNDSIILCMEECWDECPEARPDFRTLKQKKLKSLRDTLGSNVMENMLQRIQTYSKNLETLVEERTDLLKTEQRKTEALLHRMLPRSVAEDLKRGKNVEASYHDCVTICFTDIAGFTKLCSQSSPYQIVKFLNDLYTRFDEIIDNYDVYKVETIGDAYMVVSGLPRPNGDNHAGEIASMSLHLLRALSTFKIHHRPRLALQLRIGIHSGPVAVGVVGFKMPRYCLFGDTVNTTSRMESNGEPFKVHCSKECKDILDTLGGYYLEERGRVNMKGKGDVLTYWLLRENSFHRLKRLAEGSWSACDGPNMSTRSSFEDNLHLMPNGFRQPKLTQDDLLKFYSRPNLPLTLRHNSLRRGSMPVNSAPLSCRLTRRRGSTPFSQPSDTDSWNAKDLNSLPVIIGSQGERAGPEGCDCELSNHC